MSKRDRPAATPTMIEAGVSVFAWWQEHFQEAEAEVGPDVAADLVTRIYHEMVQARSGIPLSEEYSLDHLHNYEGLTWPS